ncbi:MAG: STT3 domain-containing protein [archaeon]|jgi:dolichyl-diphosphooligosaccharide--protein glycosyltransferase
MQIKNSFFEKIFSTQTLLLLVIFLLAFSVRTNFVSEEYLHGPDPYYHARLTGYLIQIGEIPTIDPLAYYQIKDTPIRKASFLDYFTAAIYQIIYPFEGYDKEKLVSLAMLLPAIFATLCCLVMFFLGKELFGKTEGFVMAFILAILPAFIFRSVAGFFENDALGALLLLLVLLFFVRATKRQNYWDLLISILFIGLLSITWKMYIILPLSLVSLITVGQLVLSIKNLKQERIWIKFSLIVLLVMTVIFPLLGVFWWEDVSADIRTQGQGADSLIFLAGSILGIIISLGLFKVIAKLNEKGKHLAKLGLITCFYLSISFGLFGVVIFSIALKKNVLSFILEEALGYSFFIRSFGVFLLIIILSILLIPVKIFFSREPLKLTFIFILSVVGLLLGLYKLKFIFVFGILAPLSIGLALFFLPEVINQINLKFKVKPKKHKIVQKVTLIIFGVILLVGASQVTLFNEDDRSFAYQKPEVFVLAEWLHNNTDSNAKLMNWWELGHVITFISERKVSSDNQNWPCPTCGPNKNFAEFVLETDINNAFLIASKRIGADYVILDARMLSHPDSVKAHLYGVTNDNVVAGRYIDCLNALNLDYCNSALSSNLLNKTLFSWKNLDLNASKNYVYGGKDFVLLLNQVMNNTNMAKVFFESEETKVLYTKVYDRQGIRVFRINK